MAAINVTSDLTSRLATITYVKNGDLVFGVDFDDANGVTRGHKVLRIKADGSGVYDERGTLLTPNSPAALVNNLNTVQGNIDAALTTLIAANKIVL